VTSDPFQSDIAAIRSIPEVEDILREVCALTGMGFAAVARVTADRWIACQVLDRIEFGLNPGDELEIKTTICDEIRASRQGVYIDEVAADPDWMRHHTPALYGFKSYISWPIIRRDGSFFGTLCAIDPAARPYSLAPIVPHIEEFAQSIAERLDRITASAAR
jgi:GAF domain-containing protein